MGFSLRRWLLSTLSQREVGADQLDWKYLRFSYSQFGEDLIAASHLPDKPGFYVDVGAFHPVRLSNTYRFYRHGWRGLVVDANPHNLKQFERRRPRDLRVHAAVSDVERDAVFEIHAAGTTSSLQRDSADPAEPAERPPQVVERIHLRTRTLRGLLDEHVPSGVKIDFLSVDCEREDLAVLRSNDWSRYRPAVVAVEDWEPEAARSEICGLLRTQGYELAATVHVSRIFRRVRDQLA
jgi:FkbM family methyltransferase